jgi:hypothetical protein
MVADATGFSKINMQIQKDLQEVYFMRLKGFVNLQNLERGI